ncbi:MAG TPA: response regulator [Candidatus Lachnoclostridium pullistercoris]|uniref:Stage 0 sporulation protein A homolog n=1 Tax=Candidatus Lachnoclostridium pullistercoris TaxID=2838632 RepID=A0A9D2PE55_9FIRM|nr:response regulator [Candidatus Lachnoclostridium pullistercoris]
MKILIVDDETPIREWIQFSIERGGREDLQVAAVAENGEEAFKLALKHHVDVVITDIRMPGMDGIELMKKILEAMPYTYFIILTNYAEFSYAREAITYGAKKYLLKSEMRGKDILDALEEIREDMDRKTVDRSADRYSNGYLDIFDCYYNLDKEEFLMEFWQRHEFRCDEWFQVIAMEKRDSERQMELFEEFRRKEICHSLVPAMKNSSIYFIVQAAQKEDLQPVREQFFRMYAKSGQGLAVSGRIRKGIGGIMPSLEEAEKVLQYSFVCQGGFMEVETAEALPPLNRADIQREYSKTLNGLLYESRETVLANLERWFDSLKGPSLDDLPWVRETCLKMVIRIEEVCAEHISDYGEEHKPDTSWTLEYCRRFCKDLVDRIYSEENFRYSQSVREAIRYIHENYARDITLNEVAGHIYRSPEYFSRLFKAETGEKFSTYLTAYRIRRARDLLSSTDMKIYEIAYAVGYTSPSYFSKMYREYMGVAPEVTRSQKNNRM